MMDFFINFIRRAQRKLLGYDKISNHRSIFFYISLFFNIMIILYYIYNTLDVFNLIGTEFIKYIISIIGMLFSLILFVFFDISLILFIFIIMINIFSKFFFELVFNISDTMSIYFGLGFYVLFSIMLIIAHCLGFILLGHVYVENANEKVLDDNLSNTDLDIKDL